MSYVPLLSKSKFAYDSRYRKSFIVIHDDNVSNTCG